MKFRNITDKMIVAYYKFLPGEEVEVTEEHLIRKFKLYDTLEEVDEEIKKSIPRKVPVKRKYTRKVKE